MQMLESDLNCLPIIGANFLLRYFTLDRIVQGLGRNLLRTREGYDPFGYE